MVILLIMALLIAALNSGSNGNCYYIGNENEAVLIDAGISCRETEKRMLRLGLNIHKVKGIFISHEHSDHIKGLETLVKKYRLPVYITANTLRNCNLSISRELVIDFTAYRPVTIGGLQVTAFPKSHDACDPHSFIISCQDVKAGVFTDIGSSCEHLKAHFRQCHAAFLEANYDDEMLHNGSYPYHLKQRIRSDNGHLSNKQALELFASCRPDFMSHIVLSHLSKDNNCPELVSKIFKQIAGKVEVIVASRYIETDIYHINGSCSPVSRAVQMALSF